MAISILNCVLNVNAFRNHYSVSSPKGSISASCILPGSDYPVSLVLYLQPWKFEKAKNFWDWKVTLQSMSQPFSSHQLTQTLRVVFHLSTCFPKSAHSVRELAPRITQNGFTEKYWSLERWFPLSLKHKEPRIVKSLLCFLQFMLCKWMQSKNWDSGCLSHFCHCFCPILQNLEVIQFPQISLIEKTHSK